MRPPMLDPERDLKGATPGQLAKAPATTIRAERLYAVSTYGTAP